MPDFVNAFYELDTWMQVYWGCAIVGTTIFAVQMVLTMVGMDGTDMDMDFDSGTMDLGGSISLFSIKNFINFLVGFGWAGISFAGIIENRLALLAVTFLAGAAFVMMFFYIVKQTRKLEHNGVFNIEACMDKTVDVYLRIPAGRSGRGKVQISINGSVHEVDAMTDGEMIASGQKAIVKGIIDGSTVLVQ